MKTSSECEASGLAYAVGMLVGLGYQVAPQEEPYGIPQVLIKCAGCWIRIPVLASADGLWMLGIEPADTSEAIDEWLSNQAANAFVMLVQFRGVSGTQAPRTYLAQPEEIAAHVKGNTTGQGNALLREPLPASWQIDGFVVTVGNRINWCTRRTA